ncbi:hypothetical protein CTI12_AA453190 [Artemisia annua]|uniref:Transmembrane protein n=1 Tax=Artemisia annua TaxID=35608 RepID=A0A2U1LUA2_ARTAN|nr:hypothetical protein CTI12_AA453190 [Artemisia annua]
MEFNSIPLINSIHDVFSKCSNPLFSTIITLYTLVLIYAPSFFLRIVFSPVLNSTVIILLFLLKLGANERSRKQSCFEEARIIDSSVDERLEKENNSLEVRVLDNQDSYYEGLPNDGSNLNSYLVLVSNSLEPKVLEFVDEKQAHVELEVKKDSCMEANQTHADYVPKYGLDMKSNQTGIVVQEGEVKMERDANQMDTTMKILEWNMKAPLEIIYEAYEGEEEEDEENNENNIVSNDKEIVGCERYPSLSMYYPESDTDSSSDGDFPMDVNWETRDSVFFKWEEEEDDREELIEISLDRYGKRSIEFCHNDEDNLIEIDISTTRN